MNFSFWENETYLKNIDFLIIGSGIVGLSSALELRKKFTKSKIVVCERGILPMGASTKNAGFACFGSPTELLDDLKIMSESQVFSLVEKRWKGLEKLKSNLSEKKIDYLPYGGYELFNDEKILDETLSKLDYLNQNLKPITKNKTTYLNVKNKSQEFDFQNIKGLILNQFEGQINTGKMMFNLIKLCQSKNIIVLNSLEVSHFESINNAVKVEFKNGWHLQTKKLLITTNGFAKKLLPELNVEPARAQVLITKPIKNLKFKGTFHYDKGYYYFRNIGNRVLFGGGRNLDFKTENTSEFGLTTKVQNSLNQLLKEVILPNTPFEIEQTWSGIMGVGSEKVPIVKKVQSNVYCAVRMGGMGIAIGSLIGEDAAKLISEDV
ncbi:MAG: FAD-dependent oxidoreductase [Bacteroidota bacterium]